jgi:hypothetical protein
MIGQWRGFVGRLDRFCGRCNDGLAAVAIALALIMSLAISYRTAQALQAPERFEIVATT